MKNITLSADADLIERARKTAESQNTTLNAAFRDWLEEYAGRSGDVAAFKRVMERLRGRVVSHGPYTRDEMNER